MQTTGTRATHSLVMVHTSDVHIGATANGLRTESDGLRTLRQVVDVVRSCEADLLVLAGDTFDHARVDDATVRATADLLLEAGAEVVILPGNHDCLSHTSPLTRAPFNDANRIHVIGVAAARRVTLDSLDVEIWGRPHQDHAYMSPLAEMLPGRACRWRVVTAHGHWTGTDDDRSGYGWPITPSDLVGLDADYVALGHWDNPFAVADAPMPCHYSGAPGWAGTVNVVTLTPDRPHTVLRQCLRGA